MAYRPVSPLAGRGIFNLINPNIMAEINLWLDSYDDIYSDFDSRHYLKRRISEDFLHELRTEIKYMKQHTGDMVLLLPKEQRNEESEKIIKVSLTDFFSSRFQYYRDKCRKKLNNGILVFACGIIIMLLNTWISYNSPASLSLTFLKVLLEPAGWFLIWAGFDFLFYDFVELNKEKIFYRHLSETHVHFKAS
jgi:hypothetical protein